MNSEIRTYLTEPDESLHKTERNEYKLTPQQQMAAELMASGKFKTATAEEVGISRQQPWEWGKMCSLGLQFQEYIVIFG